MQFFSFNLKKLVGPAAVFCLAVFCSLPVFGQQESAPAKGKNIYTQIKSFSLTGGSATVHPGRKRTA